MLTELHSIPPQYAGAWLTCKMPVGFTVCNVWDDPRLLPAQDLHGHAAHIELLS